MGDKDKEAFWKGREDYTPSVGLEGIFNNPYQPPDRHKEAYDAGWRSAKKDSDR